MYENCAIINKLLSYIRDKCLEIISPNYIVYKWRPVFIFILNLYPSRAPRLSLALYILAPLLLRFTASESFTLNPLLCSRTQAEILNLRKNI